MTHLTIVILLAIMEQFLFLYEMLWPGNYIKCKKYIEPALSESLSTLQ